jgi:hypothetical protein
VICGQTSLTENAKPELRVSILMTDTPSHIPQSAICNPNSLLRRFLEFTFVFAIFFVDGGGAPSHKNESHYLCKAKHYWQSDWCQGNLFLESADAHLPFYWSIGWLTRWYSLPTVAWLGRMVAWGLLAWAWLRLARTVITRPYFGVLAAALMVVLVRQAHFAGEWIVGGVEGKCFAYVLVLLGLEGVACGDWRRCWPLLGLASAFHPIVGGWAVVGSAAVWWMEPATRRPRFISLLPALLLGGLLAAPGLLPALSLTQQTAAEVVDEAQQIYVFDRLPHHLAPLTQPSRWLANRSMRFGALFIGFLVMNILLRRTLMVGQNHLHSPDSSALGLERLMRFAWATLALSALGFIFEIAFWSQPSLAAQVLRFYWFRLADISVPLALSLALVYATCRLADQQSRWAVPALALLGLFPGWFLLSTSVGRWYDRCPPGETALVDFEQWQDVCYWAREHTPEESEFLVPRGGQTFKWHAQRSDVVNWKDIPQDAASIVAWRNRYTDIFYGSQVTRLAQQKPFRSLAVQGTERIRELALRYQADYVITIPQPPLQLPIVYANDTYVVYESRVESQESRETEP